MIERAFKDRDDLVARQQADQHPQGQGDEALDEHPAQVFEMLEKRFYRSALFLFMFAQAFLSRFVGHGRDRLANQGLVPGED